MLPLKNLLTILLVIGLVSTTLCESSSEIQLDSLTTLLDEKLNRSERINVLHHACKLLYASDDNHEMLSRYGIEGFNLAKKYGNYDQGSDFAVWIIRSNIYLRYYEGNPEYYAYLKDLYLTDRIEKSKYANPLYSEIYSYLDYGRITDAEEKMYEYEELVDPNEPKQLAYYLDLLIIFKTKSKELKDASSALAKYVSVCKKIEDVRFEIIACSRNAHFYLEDSINYKKSAYYAEQAIDLAIKNEVNQYVDPIRLQLAQVYFKQNEQELFQRNFDLLKESGVEESKDHILKKDFFSFCGDMDYADAKYLHGVKNYSQAIQFLEISDFYSMEKLTKKIEKCYVKLGRYESAYKYANRLNVLQDSLYSEKNMNALKLFEQRLRDKDAQTEKIKLTNKIQSQKKSTIYFGFMSSLILLSLLFYNRILDTKVKLRTADLDDKNEKLKISLEEMEQFSYIASHDIKEPMRVVSSITGLIEKKLPESQRENFKGEFSLVKNSITQLYTLIDDLSQFLDFKSDEMYHEVVNTDNIMNQVQVMLSEKLSDINGTLEFQNLPTVYSSNSLLTVIFKNLVENGLKYNENDNPHVSISYQETGGMHEFSIKDNGIGIESKYHDYVFKMFKRIKKGEIKGSGLGLGLVSKSVERLGGRVKLISDLGKGSQFKIFLPQSYVIGN